MTLGLHFDPAMNGRTDHMTHSSQAGTFAFGTLVMKAMKLFLNIARICSTLRRLLLALCEVEVKTA